MNCSIDCEINPKCTFCNVKAIQFHNNKNVSFEDRLKLYGIIDSTIDKFIESEVD